MSPCRKCSTTRWPPGTVSEDAVALACEAMSDQVEPEAMAEVLRDRRQVLVAIDDRVVGGVDFQLHPITYCRSVVARATGLWLREPYRGSGAGLRLIRAAEDWMVEYGPARMEWCVANERTLRLFHRLGYRTASATVEVDLRGAD